LNKSIPGGNDATLKDYLDKVEALSGGITVADDVKLEVLLAVKDNAAAKELSDTISEALNQGLGVLAILAGQKKELAPVVDILKTVRSSAKDRAVIIKGAITSELIEKAIKEQKEK
jgi:hypothetical protein